MDTKERTQKRIADNAARIDIRLFTLTELEPILGVTHRTLLTYVKSKRIRAVKIGRKWKVTEQALRDFVEGRSDDSE